MPLGARSRFVATVGLVALLVGASALPAGAAGTPPKEWAKSVCGALESWLDDVDAASATTAKGTPKSAVNVKRKLTKLLTALERETRALVAELKDAGRPDVSGGKQIAATMRAGFEQVQSTATNAKKVMRKAPTTSPVAFLNAARGAQDAVESGLEGIQAAFSAARAADSPALLAAFAANKRCESIAA